MPLSHGLPRFRQHFPLYSENVGRIGAILSEMDDDLRVIDIGGNVGDTVVILRSHAQYPILSIEGDEGYYDILVENVGDEPGVRCVHTFLGESDEILPRSIVSDHGTGRLQVSEDAATRVVPLTTVLDQNPEFRSAGFLKIDTDGFDLAILRGARPWLAEARPVLFVEYDPFHLLAAGEDPWGLAELLADLGYHGLLVYENTGDLICAVRMTETRVLETLLEGFSGRGGNRYLDVCAFHATHERAFDRVLARERAFYARQREYAQVDLGGHSQERPRRLG
jgi:FkbM family methyltransferase